MQARLAQIMGNASEPPASQQPEPEPPAPQRQPMTVMDQIIALRQEVIDLRMQSAHQTEVINSQTTVLDAVGQAVGQIYQMLQQASAEAPPAQQQTTTPSSRPGTEYQPSTFGNRFQSEDIDDF